RDLGADLLEQLAYILRLHGEHDDARAPHRGAVVGVDRDREPTGERLGPLGVTHRAARPGGGEARLEQALEQDGADLPKPRHGHALVFHGSGHGVLIADTPRARLPRRSSRRGTSRSPARTGKCPTAPRRRPARRALPGPPRPPPGSRAAGRRRAGTPPPAPGRGPAWRP